jgi:hypothetical protein
MAGATAIALVAPWPVVLTIVLVSIALMRQRKPFLLLASATLAINAGLLALVGDWQAGLLGGLRMVAALGANAAVLSRFGAAGIVEGLRLPPRATAWCAAVLLAAEDVRADFLRLKLARTIEGAWPRGRLARIRESARLLPALLVGAHLRATVRQEALRLAGHDMPASFVPIVAVAALGAAGRLAFLALPNIALTYVVVFLGGVLWGARVGALGGALAMALTDLLLTGLYPIAFVNVPAMALLGLVGGALRRVDWSGAAGAMIAASVGIAGTFAFSAASDAGTWALLYADNPAALAPLVLLGLAFNVIPALANAALFAFSVGPCVRAQEALRPRSMRALPIPRRPEPDDAPSPVA